ncbi:MAG: two-component regulator propeller domain-containing protein [Mangrovibacterium sp.]
MQKILNLKLVILLLFTTSPILSLSKSQKLFDSSIGLSNTLINEITQDSVGFLWIATEDGLNRFDGNEFKNYFSRLEKHKLNDDFITSVFTDRKGNLWVGMINTLQKYNYQSDTFEEINLFNKNDNSTAPYISDMCQDESSNIWIATSTYGVWEYNISNKKADYLEDLNGKLKTKNIKKVFIDSEGILWIGTTDYGLYSFNRNSLELTHISMPFNHDVSDIAEIGKRIYYTSLSGSIFAYDKSTEKNILITGTANNNFNEKIAYKSILIDSKNRIWIGTDGSGLYQINHNNQLEKVNYQSVDLDFNKSKIHAILEDRTGNIWLGIFQKGLLLLDESIAIFRNYGYNTIDSQLNIGSSCVTAIEESERDIWFGTDGDGLYRINKQTQKTKHIPLNDIGGNNIISLYKDPSSNYIWIGSFLDGLIQYDIINNTAQKFNAPDFNIEKITSIKKLGNSLLLGTLGSKVCQFNIKTKQFSKNLLASNESNSAIPQYINDIYIDKQNHIWLASYDGLFHIIPNNGQIIKYDQDNKLLPSNLVYTIFEDSKGNVWAGTYRGLVNISSEKLYTIDNGLGSNVICSILEDKQNILWVSTHKGISYLPNDSPNFSTFYREDGLQADEFYKNAAIHSASGDVYFGGINGVTQVNQNYLNYSPELNNVILTKLDIFNNSELPNKGNLKSIVIADTILFKEQSSAFAISFASNAIANQTKINYKYMLEGFDNDWISPLNNANTATYTNLFHGKYTFRVKALYKGLESAERSITVIILPPWYKTIAASILWIILAIALIIALFLSQKERILRQEIERSNERRMQFFINISHEIKTPLSLILDPLNKLISTRKNDNNLRLYKTMHTNAHRILRLSNQILDIRKIEKKQLILSFHECEIYQLIAELSASYATTFLTKQINFNIDCSNKKTKVWIDIENFEKVIFNIISNAIKYTPENGNINITIYTNNKLRISIFNSGDYIATDELEKIFSRFYQTQNSNRVSGTGIGLDLSRSLINLHHGHIWAENDKENKGVNFIIELPLGNTHIRKADISIDPIQIPSYKLPNFDISDSNKNSESIEKQACIMIIDDDKEILNYLKFELETDFKILTYNHSEDAIKDLEQTTPNLVICDIMMPKITGFALCSLLKNDASTSHIPIILLSASNNDEHQENGISCGADLYLTKPFDSKVLRRSIINILENRRRIYQNALKNSEGTVDYSLLNLEARDENLLQKIVDFINLNIADQNLSVDTIAKEMGMSRVHLYRKLKEFTNLSVSDFIKNTRMKLAANILKSGKVSISEAAYKLGYSSPSYFSKSFKSHYGVSPKDFIQNNNTN